MSDKATLSGRNGEKYILLSKVKQHNARLIAQKKEEKRDTLEKKRSDKNLEIQDAHNQARQQVAVSTLKAIPFISKGLLYSASARVPEKFSDNLSNATVAYYPLEKDALDYSGNNRHATPNDKLKFKDGYPDFTVPGADIVLPDMMRYANNFGISCWVWIKENKSIDGAGAKAGTIVTRLSKRHEDGSLVFSFYYDTSKDKPDNHLLTIDTGSDLVLSPKMWHHLAITYDHKTREFRFYLNGENWVTKTLDLEVSNLPQFPYYQSIGGTSRTSSYVATLNGYVADVYLFSTTPTKQDVIDLYSIFPARRQSSHIAINPIPMKAAPVTEFVYDADGEELYTIIASNTIGKNPLVEPELQDRIIYYESQQSLSALAVDAENKLLFWIQDYSTIVMRSMGSPGIEQLITLSHSAAASNYKIALDTQNKKIYWTDNGIWSADYNGDGEMNIISSFDAPQPVGLALSEKGQRIYWLDKALNKIRSCSLEGQDIHDLLCVEQPRDGLILDEYESQHQNQTHFSQSLYWLTAKAPDNNEESYENIPWLMTANLDNPQEIQVIGQVPIDSSFAIISKGHIAYDKRLAAHQLLQRNKQQAADDKRNANVKWQNNISEKNTKFQRTHSEQNDLINDKQQEHKKAKQDHKIQLNQAINKKNQKISEANDTATQRRINAHQQATTLTDQARHKANKDKARARSNRDAAQRERNKY